MTAEGDAHREWHHNTGIPMGTPGCPQDACHRDDWDYPEPRKLRPIRTAANTLSPHPVASSDLLWIPSIGMFVGEMSSIGHFARVWPDACDVGITLVSSRYNKSDIVFVVDHEERDGEGDTLHWDLVAVNPPAGFPGFTVRIHNT